MARSDRDPSRGWSLVLEEGAGVTRVFRVRAGAKDDAAAVVEAVRVAIVAACASGGCRSISIGVHVEGAACDHEVKA
jgi:hypothetical protein